MHGQDEHGQIGALRMDIADELESVPLSKRDVDDDDIRNEGADCRPRLTLCLDLAAHHQVGFGLDHAS